ncbi:hypothetical protein Dimus_010999 [Dionaea muscipula]
MEKTSIRLGNGRVLFICNLALVLLVVIMGGLETGEGTNTTAADHHHHLDDNKVQVKVGVVVDMDLWVGKLGMSCIDIALSDFYASRPHYNTRLILHTRDSMEDVVTAAAAVLDLIENVKVEAIIGPTTSPEAQFVIQLGDKAQVPIVTYSATSPLLASIASPYFVQATQDDSSQVQAITALIQAFGWREVVPVYEDNEFGGGLVPYLEDALQQIGDRVPYRSRIPSSASDEYIDAELYKLMTMQTRVFVVHITPTLGSRLFLKAAGLGMMGQDYVWIISNALANVLNILAPNVISSMQGVLGVKTYVPSTSELNDFSLRWHRQFVHDNPTVVNPQLNAFGLWAYDAVSALARAIEHVDHIGNLTIFQEHNTSTSLDVSKIPISQTGPQLLDAIRDTRFQGLSGNFSLVNGQLDPSVFQLINVVGNGEKEIGFWTRDRGIVRQLNSGNTSTGSVLYSTSRSDLGAIIWPGDSTSVPKGWVIPTNGKKLRIGVPVKNGFTEFVTVKTDPSTNSTLVTGYCIDVFEAVISILPYSVPFEYVPFQKPDGESAGTYNELLYQIYLQKFDAVVGDTTIIANRSLYVDFTLPYTESGVTMVVPMKGSDKKNAWIFLRPLSSELWITSLLFFAFMAFVIWALEHRINPQFQGPMRQQVGTSLYYSFSTMVFAHGHVIFNNLTRLVVIIWVFLLLILTQSYTASLASLLTVEQLQPTVTDIKELIKQKEFIGYQEGSFVLGLLKQMNVDDTRLRTYKSAEELDDLLTKGSANGGVAAALDEIPYLNLFLASRCSKYTTVPPTYKTDGFGFAFPIGSPLVSDISRAILNVTEGEKMVEINNAWFKQQNCADSDTSVSSTSLNLDDFRGLFMIIGVAATLALLASVARFLYDHRTKWLHSDPNISILSRIKKLLQIFQQPNLDSHTMRRSCEIHDAADHASFALIPTQASDPQTPPSDLGTPNTQHFGGPPIPSSQGEPSTPPSPEHHQEIALEMPNLHKERSASPEINTQVLEP